MFSAENFRAQSPFEGDGCFGVLFFSYLKKFLNNTRRHPHGKLHTGAGSGNDQFEGDSLRSAAKYYRHLAEGIYPALSPRRLGRTRSDGDLLIPVCRHDGGHHPKRRRGAGHQGNRHHQSERDDHPVGQKDWPASLQRHRLAVQAHSGDCGQAGSGGLRRVYPLCHRAGARRLLLRNQDCVDSRPHSKWPRAPRRGSSFLARWTAG